MDFDDKELNDKELKELEEEINGIKDAELEEAYQESPKRYNELFDNYQRIERENRKEEGTYTMDDFLDDLEDEREKDNTRTR